MRRDRPPFDTRSVFAEMLGEMLMQQMIASDTTATVPNPSFFTQEHARVAEEEEEEVAPSKGNGKRKRKPESSTPVEPRIKWTNKEDECLAEAWKIVSMDPILGANQNPENY
ncbi:hypothetical protein QYE76_024419 [Lolium multiflorum]|uniref:Uncharacterized protein n=1 Tax=Lolium multiflorum TaxID=4521 RepID=A0AAD8VTA0_LOLMU|nr:hypothetical protein QYE76_024419 [Lolium multiflorum]